MENLCFGMPTLIEAPGIEESVNLCDSLGLSFVELSMNLPQYQIHTIDIKKCEQLKQLTGIGYTLHLHENLNTADFNLQVSKAYLETVRAAIEIARRLEIPIINMHLSDGVYFTLPEEKIYLFEQYRDKYLDSMRELREVCEDKINGSPISICVENCGGYMDFQKEAIDLLLESPCFGLTFDIGHDYTAGNVDESFIRARSDKLRHMHIHDALEKRNHLPLGSGKIDIFDKLSLGAAHNCRFVLETKTIAALKQSIEYLRLSGHLPVKQRINSSLQCLC